MLAPIGKGHKGALVTLDERKSNLRLAFSAARHEPQNADNRRPSDLPVTQSHRRAGVWTNKKQ
jgi:hypothetical protein